MLILALDSSSPMVSIAMLDYSHHGKKSSLLYDHCELQRRTDSSSFFRGLEQAISTIGKPDLLVVGLGPGAYNGLRVSIAAAQGMASALGVELRGIPSVLALNIEEPRYWILGDARGGTYWMASVLHHQFDVAPTVLAPEKMQEFLLAKPDLPLFSSTPLPKLSQAQQIIITFPCAAVLGRISQEISYQENSLIPLYLKPIHITPAASLRCAIA